MVAAVSSSALMAVSTWISSGLYCFINFSKCANWLVTCVLSGPILVCSFILYKKDFKAKSMG